MRRVRRVAVTAGIGTVAYTADDVVGGLMTFAITDQGFDGQLTSVLVTDAAAQGEAYTLYIFESVPSTIADDAAWAPTLADLKKLVTTVTVGTVDYSHGGSVALLGEHEDAQMKVPLHSDNGDLYIYAVATDTPDYAAVTDLTFTATVEVF